MRRRQLRYNGKGIRLDGNHSLGKIILPSAAEAYTVAMGFCGLDGSLLVPVEPLKAECWEEIEPMLRRLLQELKQVMLEFGFKLDESRPVFLSTDTYAKHRLLYQKLFADIWSDMRVHAESDTPKGRAKRRRILPQSFVLALTIITGDPLHCIIKMRLLVSPHISDGLDFKFDYIDMINRLSAASPSRESLAQPDKGGLPDLCYAARSLLRCAVKLPKAKFDQVAVATPADVRSQLKAFMAHSQVHKAPEWRRIFGARPPRGTLARLARRAGTPLHPKRLGLPWTTKRAFRKQIGRLIRWYKPGRKALLRRRGIRRGHRAGPSRLGRKTVMTAKLRKHFAHPG